MASLKYWLWLATRPNLSGQHKLRLLHHFASPENVYYAAEEDLMHVETIGRPQLETLADKSLLDAEDILQRCIEKNVFVITMDDALYPTRLKAIYDAPIVLYGKGKMPLFDDEVAITMVGTRSCTAYGLASGELLGCDLGRRGAVVVSGMAKGIDTACLRGALRGGGFVCAVLAGGVDVIYPAENRGLYNDILQRGVILSESPPGTTHDGWRFPPRNRLMSGLSLGTVVVEADVKSGALITAQHAADQGRDVFCVPGPIRTPSSAGCHQLIRSGAILATCAQEILEEYASLFPHKLRRMAEDVAPLPAGSGPQIPPPAATPVENTPQPPAPALPRIVPAHAGLTEDQTALLRALSAERPALTDDLAEQCQIPVRRVLSALTMLEIDGYVEKTGAQSFRRTVEIEE